MKKINETKKIDENNKNKVNIEVSKLQDKTRENISKIEIKDFFALLEEAKENDVFFCSRDIKDIENFLNWFENTENSSLIFYDIKVDSYSNNIKDEIKNKLPFMLERYAFYYEWFTGVRYYVFKKKDYLKIAVWFYWWSGWRWNDRDFRDFFDKNREKRSLKLSKILESV